MPSKKHAFRQRAGLTAWEGGSRVTAFPPFAVGSIVSFHLEILICQGTTCISVVLFISQYLKAAIRVTQPCLATVVAVGWAVVPAAHRGYGSTVADE